MISVILYGKNDSYGYNLHKRAAISLNTLAYVLTDPDDEILFVDYNTPDDLPTFPEAIRDTLTEKTRNMLRIIRVRGRIHDTARLDSPLGVCEPLARNIAIRRMRPANRWVLSTNTDMVFVPAGKESLSDIAAGLPDGYYALPRFEIPETLWETSNRLDPAALVSTFARWGDDYCLDEIVYGRPYILYDAPGDFQLFPREAAVRIHGYNERMVYGWHLDSNICKRMSLHFGPPRSLAGKLRGYHCDHTRVTTPMHASGRTENDWRRFCEDVTRPDLPDQAETWGRPDETFEELSLKGDRSAYESALAETFRRIRRPGRFPSETVYREEAYNNNFYYDTVHTFPFLSDSLVSMPRDSSVAYVGRNETLTGMLGAFLGELGFTKPVLVHDPTGRAAPMPAGQGLSPVDDIGALAAADLFLFDLHFPESTKVRNRQGHDVLRFSGETLRDCTRLMTAFLRLAFWEQQACALGCRPRKILVVSPHNTHFEELIDRVVGLIVVTCSCHVRHGFVRPGADVRQALRALEYFDRCDDAAFESMAAALLALVGDDERDHHFQCVYDTPWHIMRRVGRDPAGVDPAERPAVERTLHLMFALAVIMGRFPAAVDAHVTLLRLAASDARRDTARQHED